MEIVVDSLGREAIKEGEKLISEFHDSIDTCGLLNDKSDYYIVADKYSYAIFHKDEPMKPISDWHETISVIGLVNGDSSYYITENREKFSIFHLKDAKNPVFSCDDLNTVFDKYEDLEDIETVENRDPGEETISLKKIMEYFNG